MKYLKLFENYQEKSEEEEKEEIEDALIIEGIFDDWNLLEKEYIVSPSSSKHDTRSISKYTFKLEPKKTKYLFRKNTNFLTNVIRKGEFFDDQVNELTNRINHSRLNKLGYEFKVNWTYEHEGYFENGDSKYRVDIWISVYRWHILVIN